MREERREADAFLRDVQTVSARNGNSAGGWRTQGDTSNRGQLTADLQGERRAAPWEGVDGLWSQHRLRGPAVRQPDEATTTEDETKSTNNASSTPSVIASMMFIRMKCLGSLLSKHRTSKHSPFSLAVILNVARVCIVWLYVDVCMWKY